jgi:two-component system KDP operon response regulator KdpE
MRRQPRAPDAPPPVIHSGDVVIDLPRRLVTRRGEPVRLSPKEYDLLAKLAEADGKVLTHKELLVSLWGPAHVEDTQYLRVFIGQLRQKIEADAAQPKLILTQPGIGYRFIADDVTKLP